MEQDQEESRSGEEEKENEKKSNKKNDIKKNNKQKNQVLSQNENPKYYCLLIFSFIHFLILILLCSSFNFS